MKLEATGKSSILRGPAQLYIAVPKTQIKYYMWGYAVTRLYDSCGGLFVTSNSVVHFFVATDWCRNTPITRYFVPNHASSSSSCPITLLIPFIYL